MSVDTALVVPTRVERTSGKIVSTLTDENGAAIALADINTLTLTLYDRQSLAIINSRNAQNVLNANGVTVGVADGVVTWTVTPADMQIVRSGATLEHHVALFIVTWSGSAKSFPWQIIIPVENLPRFP